MKIAGKRTRNNNNFTVNKNIIIAVVAALTVVALIVGLIVLLPSSNKDEGAKPTTINKAPIVGISIEQLPKTDYYVGEELDKSGLIVKVNRSDSTSDLIDANDPELNVWGFDSSGIRDSLTVYVDYKNFRTSYEISVESAPVEVVGTITGITIVSTPNSFYYVGDTFDPSGIVVAVTVAESETPFYVDGTNAELVVSGFNSAEVNEALPITVSFRGVSATYNVAIKDPSYREYEIIGLHIVSTPQTTYYMNQPFDSTGLRVLVLTDKQDTNFYIEVDDPKLTISGFDSSVVAENQVITVSYEGFKVTFTVTIKEIAAPKPTLESIELVDFIDTYTIERWNLNGPNVYGAYFKLHYSDGTVVGSKDETPLLGKYIKPISSMDGPGTTEIVIEYQGITITVTITITE